MTKAARWYLAIVGAGLVAVALIDRFTPKPAAVDVAKGRTVDSLILEIARRDDLLRAEAIEHAHWKHVADRSAAAARRAIEKPRTAFVTSPDTATHGDTVQRILIMRAVDSIPFLVPRFLIDELAEQEREFAYVMQAWQDSEKARLFADSVYIPDLKRQIADGGKALRLERERVTERDGIIRQQDRALKVEKAKGKLGWLLALVAAGYAIAR